MIDHLSHPALPPNAAYRGKKNSPGGKNEKNPQTSENSKIRDLQSMRKTQRAIPYDESEIAHNDDQNSLKAGSGPSLLVDFHRPERITHFDHERIPERGVHARGSAALQRQDETAFFALVTEVQLTKEEKSDLSTYLRTL